MTLCEASDEGRIDANHQSGRAAGVLVTDKTIRLLDDGTYQLIDAHGRPLKDANTFLAALKTRGLSILTIRAYGFDLVVLLRWLAQEHRRHTDLKTSDLLAFIDTQRQNGAQPNSITTRFC